MLLRALLITCSALIGGSIWLVASESGLQTVTYLAGQASGGQLQIEPPQGRLIGPLLIPALHWKTTELQVDAEQITLDWSPAALLQPSLQISELTIGKLRISSAASSEPTPPPLELRLPLAVDVQKLAISRLEYGDSFAAERIAGRLNSDGLRHQLSEFIAETSGISIHGQAALDGATPLPLTATAEITGQLAEHPLALSLKASGPLERIALTATSQKGIEGQAQVELTPFALTAFASAQIALDNIDPAAWQEGAPAARLNLRTDLSPLGEGVAGSFSIFNAQAGPIDQQRLPFTHIAGQLDWQGENTRLTALKIQLSGTGTLTGSGELKKDQLELALAVSQLDAAKLVSTLRSTRLNGNISSTLSAEQQAFKLDLKDSQFALLVDASRVGDQIDLTHLQISAGNARLAAKGELGLVGMHFAASGELSHFDPSRFAKVPEALINARFTAKGKLQPRPVITGSFELLDSKVADHALAGHGQLSVDWPSISLADVTLTAGPNQLSAKGAYGRPGDSLDIVIAAPQLSPYGIEGGFSAQFKLAGSVQQPEISGQLQAAALGLPGKVKIKDLTLKTVLGAEPDSPLLVDLGIAQIDTPDQLALAKDLHIKTEGRNQAHRLSAKLDLIGDNHLNLAAEGGLNLAAKARSWNGRLLEAGLKSADQTRNFQLTVPAALKLSADHWFFGPAQLAGNPLDWQATLEANADPHQLKASLKAHGSRLGQISGQLTAGMLGAWSLDQQRPWQGGLQTDIADLGWLAELIGDQWQSAGRFNGELKLAGTPAKPLATGSFRGEKLAFRLPAQDFNLANGELLMTLDNNILRVKKLGFDSLLKALPRELRLGASQNINTLTKQAGRLEISGEIPVDRSQQDTLKADKTFLDFQLDRLGAFQLPDQWMTISGKGRLSLQGDTIDIKGQLGVDAGYWQLAPGGSPRLSDDVVITRPGDNKTASKMRPKLDLDISADLGKNFLFKGAGLSSHLTGNIHLRASGRDLPRATGSIRASDGRFDAYGQQLDIERGILTFQGLLDNPGLDVRAVRKGLSVEPGVQISGTVQKPVIRLISDPELPEAEKLAWLVLGHGSEQMSAGDATVLLSAAGGLLGNDSPGVVEQVKKTFGIDEIGLRQGELGSLGGRQAGSRIAGGGTDTTAATGNQIFSIGKRLSRNTLLSYEQTLGKAEGIVKLTVNLSRQISLVGRAGSDNALDIFYTLTFGKPPRKSRRGESE
jgi:translocation and assembly module TamB